MQLKGDTLMKVGPEEQSKVGLAVHHRRLSDKHLLLLIWMTLGLLPLALQIKSFVRFVTPHKISLHFIVPVNAVKGADDVHKVCPVEELFVANVYWNIEPTQYYSIENGQLCHFVIPQYNIHGIYFLGAQHSKPSPNTQRDCTNDSFPMDYFFYHGSFGYYAFYEEGTGTYCSKDNKGYVKVKGLGTFDANGAALAEGRADAGYRRSYWYGITGSLWIAYRACLLRRSYMLCKQHGARCHRAQHTLRLADAAVYVQESMRLSAHNARNYHRFFLLYLLLEGVMSELFMLIATEGVISILQYLSLGYNLSGVMSMLFEIIEVTQCLRERTRCLFKRLLFNHETVMIGELICAGAMQHYLTAISRTKLKDSKPVAEATSYYVWSLVGHAVVVVACVIVLTVVRSLGAITYVRYRYGCFTILAAPCCVDTTMGVRCKLIQLSGYSYENEELYYEISTLATFGMHRAVEEDGSEFFAFHRMNWITVLHRDLFVIGVISNLRVTPCEERQCGGIVSMFGHKLGGVY